MKKLIQTLLKGMTPALLPSAKIPTCMSKVCCKAEMKLSGVLKSFKNSSLKALIWGNILMSKSESFYLPCTGVNKQKACPIVVTTNLVYNKALILYS